MPEDFNDLTVEELKDELREHDLKVSGNKEELVERLEAFADTGEVVEDESEGGKEETLQTTDAPTAEQEEDVLVRMDRQNASFTWGGVTFKPSDPFRVLPRSKAETLMDNFSGFNVARPSEAEQYYS